ncbi:MAG: penicillin-binding protein activator [Proteobacteria bacterium]|nr:penicillin-binding protein activator [Pseudomonadota bacterium]
MKKYKFNCIHYLIAALLSFSLLNGCKSAAIYSQSSPNDQVQSQGENAKYSQKQAYSEFSKQPKQIALLLPLTGKHADSAKAIREGFLANYYQQHGTKPNIKIYDTAKDGDIQHLYESALHEGADFVVGPLSKEEVHLLSQRSSHKVPVLALNHHPDVKASSKDFVQYTLAPETEAEQIAIKAWQQGFKNAGLIVPDNAWGKRIANAFGQKWQQQGGRIIRTVYLNASYDQSDAVRRLLGIDESQKRASQVKALLAEKVEFQPKRRKDLDVIMLAAPPDQARQIKPLLDFYYAEDVPVYATSSVYSGQPNPKRDRDMNGIVFCDMPWLINSQQAKKLQQLMNQEEEQSDQYHRLFAMGVDAYQISNHYYQLQAGKNITGATGQLSLKDSNIIDRQLTWAKMVDGVPTNIN